MRKFVSRQKSVESGYWDFTVEVAVLLSEQEVARFQRMEIKWILNGTQHIVSEEQV